MTPDDRHAPAVSDPANRTRLSWTRTSLAFVAIGGAMLKSSPIEGLVVLALSVPIWAVARRMSRAADAPSSAGPLRLVTVTVVLVALAALGVVFFGQHPASLGQLLSRAGH